MSVVRHTCRGIFVLLLLLGFGRIVYAHADFVRSDPPANSVLQTAPERIQLWFSEPLEPGFSEVQVLDASRNRVDRGDSRIAADDPQSMIISLLPLEPGTYTVAWKALSAVDGHITRGTFTLSIGVAAPAAPPAPVQETAESLPFEAAIRWLNYLAATVLAGVFLFRGLVLAPATEQHPQGSLVDQAVRQPLRRLSWIAWALLLGATFAAFVLQVTVVADSGLEVLLSDTTTQLLFKTRYGLIWIARVGLILGLGLLLLRSYDGGRRAWWGAVILSGAILLTTSLNSHSAAIAGSATLAIAADWLHQVAVALWAGGLAAIAVGLPAGLRSIDQPARRQLLVGIIPRFSALAIASVAALIVTGIYQMWLHVGSLDALRETLYGQSLLLKLAVITPLLLLGAANLLIIRPRLSAAVGTDNTEHPTKLGSRFSQIVAAEAILAILVLLITGLMTSLPPGRQTYERIKAARPLEMQAQARDLRLALTLAPARPGPNTLTIQVEDAAGEPLVDAERVSINLTYLDEALGSNVVIAEPEGEGRYVAQNIVLGLEGSWQAELLVRRAGQEDVRTAFRFAITPSSAVEERPEATATSGLQLPEISTSTILALALIVIGAGLLVYVSRTLSLRSRDGTMLGLASALVICLGLYLVVSAKPGGATVPQEARSLRNPFPPTAESLAAGERIYRAQCQVCHGVNGRGDGPAAAGLNPPPADFRVHLAAGHTDGELFTWVHDGIQGTAMPAFRGRLSDEEIWHTINFIKTFASPEP